MRVVPTAACSACPTGALVGPGELDARRCLAWLVQAPGVVPGRVPGRPRRPPLRLRRLSDRLPDQSAGRPAATLLTEAEAGAQPLVDVLDLLAADDDAVMQLVGRWYIPGREPRYVRRNALIVLGNTGTPSDPAVEAALVRALHDCRPDGAVARGVGGGSSRTAGSAHRPSPATPIRSSRPSWLGRPRWYTAGPESSAPPP